MREYAMRSWLAGLLAAVAAGLGVAAAREPGAGRWLLGLAGLAVAVEAGRGWLLRPTLRVTAHGLDVVPGFARVHVPWDQVESASLDRQRRRLVTSTWLEIDTGERLYALPAYRLGAPVAEVAEEVSRGIPGRPPP